MKIKKNLEKSKLRLIQTLYGAIPKDDNPFLWTLLLEVINAANILLESEEYRKMFPTDYGREENLFSRLFKILTIAEDRILASLEKFVADEISGCNISLKKSAGNFIYLGPGNGLA